MDDHSEDSFVWTDDLVSKLIQARYERRNDFALSGKRGSTHDTWMNIIRDLHLENQVTVMGVRKKWNSLLGKFKDIENKIAVGVCSEDLAWPHYNQMQAIMNALSCQENPSILATGNTNDTVKIQFSDMGNDGLENGEEELRPSKRNKRDILDEKFIAAVQEGNEQLKKIHTTLEKQGDIFIQLMSRFVATLENPVPDDVPM